MSSRRWILLISILFALLCGGAALAFSPLVRSKAQQKADLYHLSLQIGSVRPALFGVRLNDVSVHIPDVPSLSLHFDSVVVKDGRVSVQGGSASVHGDRSSFAQQIEQWRAKVRSRASPTSSSRSKTKIAIHGLSLSWPQFEGANSKLELQDLQVDDLFAQRSVTAGKVVLQHPRVVLRGNSLTLAWTAKKPTRIASLEGRSLTAEVWLDAAAGVIDSSAAVGSAAPPASSAGPPSKPPPKPATPTSPTSSLRDRIAKLATVAWTPMTPDARIEVRAFEVLVHRGKEEINIGPGFLAAQTKKGALLVDLAPRVEEGKKGITFRASVPMGAGDVIFDVVGGPISLRTLGVREKNLGLIKVAETQLSADAHVKLHADGKNLSFDGTVGARNVSLSHVRLARHPVQGLELAAKLRGQVALDGSFVRIDDGSIEVGKVQLQLRGTIDRTRPKMRVDMRFGIPLVGCQDFLDALPETLAPVVHGMTAAGTLSLKGHLRYDEENLDDFFLEYAAGNDCRITSVPPNVDVRKFTRPFKRKVYDAKGNEVEIEAGPGTPGWVSHGGISRFMEAAVMTCEDGRFRRHRGFDHEAIHNSVRENLKAGKFLRGASTISMQLAKNLYLSRDKTISRKLQELILTSYLEQALTKNQIMTLYLNVIEFGPMTYGVGKAASRYFHKHSASLSLGQAMYLASILPNPRIQHFVQDGRVSDGWMRYLYKLMKIAAKMGWITQVDLDYGLGEWVVYGSPDPVRIEPDPSAEIDPEGPADGAAAPSEEPFGWHDRGDPVY